MARDIEVGAPLTKGDKQYLLQRPWLIDELRLQGADVSESMENPDEDDFFDELENVGEEYEGWRKSEFVNEAKARGLETTGTVQELRQRLIDDDLTALGDGTDGTDEDEPSEEPSK